MRSCKETIPCILCIFFLSGLAGYTTHIAWMLAFGLPLCWCNGTADINITLWTCCSFFFGGKVDLKNASMTQINDFFKLFLRTNIESSSCFAKDLELLRGDACFVGKLSKERGYNVKELPVSLLGFEG